MNSYNRNQSMRDFPEDALSNTENGSYWNTCRKCNELFVGFKRRTVCKICQSSNEVNHHFVWNNVHVNCGGKLTNEQLDALKKLIEEATKLKQ